MGPTRPVRRRLARRSARVVLRRARVACVQRHTTAATRALAPPHAGPGQAVLLAAACDAARAAAAASSARERRVRLAAACGGGAVAQGRRQEVRRPARPAAQRRVGCGGWVPAARGCSGGADVSPAQGRRAVPRRWSPPQAGRAHRWRCERPAQPVARGHVGPGRVAAAADDAAAGQGRGWTHRPV